MSNKCKANLLKYGISAIICAGMVYLFTSSRNLELMERLEQYRNLCDAFTIPGVVFLGLGILLYLSDEGALDGVTYACTMAFRALLPGGRLKIEKYFDYVQRRRANKLHGYSFLFVVGGVCIAVALYFYFRFYQLYG